MSKKFLLSAYLVFAISSLFAQNSYHVGAISTDLKKDADAVVRLYDATFEIISIDESYYSFNKVTTILDSDANDQAQFIIPYSENRKLKKLSANLYNADGKLVRKYKEKDFRDFSAISDMSLYEDARVKYLNLAQDSYPYTVEIYFELAYDYLYSIPDCYVIDEFNTAVEHSIYTLKYPSGLKARYQQINTEVKPKLSSLNGQKVCKWTFDNLMPIEKEPFSAGLFDLSPIIRAAPSKFKYEDFEGDISTWDGFSQWQLQLNKDLEDVPASIKQEVLALIEPIKGDKERVEAIYNYMQQNTRYISIQLGIGGFQPFSPAYVAEKGYGDCKALSFYTKNLLELAGIEANYTWIYSGSSESRMIDPEFPNDNFNHIVLNVPLEQDTMWLECTSQVLPAGYLGSSTSDRFALSLSDDGKAHLVRTPVYDGDKNKIFLEFNIDLKEDTDADAQINSLFSGVGTEFNGLSYYIRRSESDKQDWLRDFLSLSNYTLNTYEFENLQDSLPKIAVKANVSMRSFSNTVADRMLFSPILLVGLGSNISKDEDRISQIYLKTNREYEIKTTVKIPEGYEFDKALSNESLNSVFGSYSIEYTYDEDQLVCIRRRVLNYDVYDKTLYEDFRSFLKDIRKLENRRQVLKKIEG